MTEWREQQICIKFCTKLEHSSKETIPMIQKAIALGNWWLAASSRPHTHSCITSHARVFGEISNHPVTQPPLCPRFGTLKLLAFPKTKITFEREEISDHRWNSGKCYRAADGDWENCVRSQCAYFEGDWGIIVLCTMFLVSYIFFNKCLYFSYYMLGTFWTDLVYTYIHVYIHTYIHIYLSMCVCVCITLRKTLWRWNNNLHFTYE